MRNWAGTLTFTPSSIFQPNTIDEVRQRIKNRQPNEVFRPLGAIYSFSNVIDANNIVAVDCTKLRGWNAFASGDANFPGAWANPQIGGLIWAQSGLRIHDVTLIGNSGGRNLSPFTLGGSTGQALIGAASTSTHGADFNLTPLPDYVLAVHVVTPNGEAWVERPGLNASAAMVQQLTGCDRNQPGHSFAGADDLDALIVSMGTAGIITGVLFALRPDTLMNERTNTGLVWPAVYNALQSGQAFVAAPGDAAHPAVAGTYRFLEVTVNPYSIPPTAIVVARNEKPDDGVVHPPVPPRASDIISFAFDYGGPNPNYSNAFTKLITGSRLNGRDAAGNAQWYEMTQVLDLGVPPTTPVYSYELCWPVTATVAHGIPAYLAFLDHAVAVVSSNVPAPKRPYAGSISLRFSKATTALLAPQWSANPNDRFAHIEMSCLQNVFGHTNAPLPQNTAFFNDVLAHPSAAPARLHWGQNEFPPLKTLNAAAMPGYARWKAAITAIRGGNGDCFQTNWTKGVGLG